MRNVFIRDAWVQGVPDGRVRITLDLDTLEPCVGQVRFEVSGKNFASPAQTFGIPFYIHENAALVFSLQIKDPQVWHPWDRGFPHLYHLRVTLTDEQGEFNSYETTFGLRTIDLDRNLNTPFDSAPWTFVINGNPEFIRGANWVPADAIPAWVTREDYAELLHLVRDANINLLRVWGGGLKEKRAFYELCDDLGILVWQEFPLSGAGVDYFPPRKEFLVLARQECQAIVRTLRNHPSVILWCGGNEFIPRANRRLIEIMRDAVAKNDGTRPFKPASPSEDESHNWRVWHGFANTRDYQNDTALFFGEFGMQALPHAETLQRFLPDESMLPPNELWEYHNAEITKLWRYAQPLLVELAIQEITLAQFVEASQEAQLRGSAGRNRACTSQQTECFGLSVLAVQRAVVFDLLERRRLYAYAETRLCQNQRVCIIPPLFRLCIPCARAAGEIVSGQVWLINDSLNEVRGTLFALHNGEPVLTLDVAIAPNAARNLQSLDLMLAEGVNHLQFELRCDSLLSTNEYDLNYCDMGEINSRRAFLTNAAAWLRTQA